MDEGRVDIAAQLRDLLRVLRERWLIVLACTLIAGAAAYLYSNSRPRVYEGQATIVLQPENDAGLLGLGVLNQDPIRLSATEEQLVVVPDVARRAAVRLRYKGDPYGLLGKVHTETPADSDVLFVRAQDGNAQFAADLANAFAREAIVERRNQERTRLEQAADVLRRRLRALPRTRSNEPTIRNLRQQVDQIRVLAPLQTGDAVLDQLAIAPGDPIQPHPIRDMLIGLGFGLLIGIGLALLRDRLDSRIKTEDQVRRLLPDVPVVGTIPPAGRAAHKRSRTAESFHTLEANLELLGTRRARSVLIASASPGDGKSTTSINLALAMAARGRSSLVLEADLRRPALSHRLGIEADTGVSTSLSGQHALAPAVREVTVEASPNGNGPLLALGGTVALAPAGPLPPNPPALLRGPSVDALMDQAEALSDTVVVDGPPLGAFADMLPLAKRADLVLLVVRLYHSRQKELLRVVDQLHNAGITPSGVVIVSDADAPGDDYYNYYSYE